MRRFVLVVVFALFVIVPTATAAPPKPITVTTPMTRDLDGGRYNIANVQALYAANVFSAGLITAGTLGWNGTIQLSTATTGNGPGIMAGDADPSLGHETLMPRGTIYLRSNGELWLKTGITETSWSCIAGCAP